MVRDLYELRAGKSKISSRALKNQMKSKKSKLNLKLLFVNVFTLNASDLVKAIKFLIQRTIIAR